MEPPSTLLVKAFAAVLAGAFAFALAGGGLFLMGGLLEGWICLVAFAAVPAAVFALLPFSARIFCFALGLLAMAVTWVMDPSGPHNPLIVLPWIALCFAAAAVVAELCVRAAALGLRLQAAGSQPADRR
ncbi:MAG TPA: hypothetical protein VGB04_13635 [Allosphingosinicella sp.]